MARIPDAELERLKSEISVERLIEAAGIALRPAGKDLLGRCPFHEDREASLVVTPAKNLWHCFACQIGGGPIDWMMKAKGVSFRHAVELLREGADLPAGAVKSGRIRVLPPPVSFDADDQALLAQAIDYYHERLKHTPEALAYLDKRGLNVPALIERFKLGFADRTLGLRLPEKTRKAGAEIRSRLQKLGLWRASGHEHFNGSIVIPVISDSGEITEVYGRKITEGLRPGTPYHLYLPGPHRGVWNAAALSSAAHGSREVILCEALIDALTFWCAGYHNVTASYGIEGFTADHLAAFKHHHIERVLIAYDRDEAGDRAAEKLAKQLMAEGLDCYRILFPKGMDANEYALKVTPAGKSLGLAIRKAQWLGRGEAKPIHTVVSTPAASTAVESEAAKADRPTPMAKREPVMPPEAISTLDSAPTLPRAAIPPDAVLPASPLPSAAVAEVDAQVRDEEIVLVLGDRRYRVRGLKKNLAFDGAQGAFGGIVVDDPVGAPVLEQSAFLTEITPTGRQLIQDETTYFRAENVAFALVRGQDFAQADLGKTGAVERCGVEVAGAFLPGCRNGGVGFAVGNVTEHISQRRTAEAQRAIQQVLCDAHRHLHALIVRRQASAGTARGVLMRVNGSCRDEFVKMRERRCPGRAVAVIHRI